MMEWIICSRCNGTGEGMSEGSICPVCRGRGEVQQEMLEEPEEVDEEQQE